MDACYLSPLWEPLGAAANHLSAAAALLGQAEAVIAGADGSAWVSPAAALYRTWLAGARRRCASARLEAEQSSAMMDAYQAMLPAGEDLLA
ncbi:MAG: hypothetical protein LBD51_09200 [Bifidobacteriaceae bacterium]|jgi:hypothetical protein|nr:hypothetical protein [Bifidobacteriaceae bacterium]